MFTNYAMLGIADCLSLFYVTLISRFFGVKGVIRFVLIAIAIISILFITFESRWTWVTPVGILLLRLQMVGLENYRYHLTTYLFPVLYRSFAAGAMNFVSRGLVSLSFIVVEYTDQPIYIILFLSVITLSVTMLIEEPKNRCSNKV